MKKILFLSLLLFAAIATTALAATTDDVIISEVVTDPQTDWSTNDFDGTDGDGAITSSDEYIELYNASGGDLDIRGWQIVMTDTTPATHTIDASLVKNETIDGDISVFPAGAYWVLGNPVGAMNNTLRIELYDGDPTTGATLVNSVTIGYYDDGMTEDNAPEGNATNDSDEAVARGKLVANSNVDAVDFRQMIASPGHASPNTPPMAFAGPDHVLWHGDKVIFDATNAWDFDQEPLAYKWEFIGVRKTFAKSNNAVLTRPMKRRTSVACLRVTDGSGAVATDAATIIALPSSWQKRYGAFDNLPIRIQNNLQTRVATLALQCQ